jgi:site-specific recombinase XerD
MLRDYYKDSRRIRRLRKSLIGEYLDAYSDSFKEQGYSNLTVKGYLRTAFHFAQFALWEGKTEIRDLTPELANQFLNEHLPNCSCERMNCGKYADATAGTAHLLNFLEKEKLIEKPAVMHKNNWQSDTLARYDAYLDNLLGLCKKSRNVHRKKATIFMEWLKERHGKLELSNINNADILDFQIALEDNGYSTDFKQTITSCLRGFLRFLRWDRIVEHDFTPAVFTLIQWKLSSVPKYMPFDDVKLLLQAPDRNTTSGKRDLAMLILMAHLGLRASEVINLRVSDIDFLNGTLLIRQTKTSRERILPLTLEIAEILIDYIKNGRQNQKCDGLFLRTFAPYTPIANPSSVGTMISKYLKETGIKSPTLGTHQLRHSLATHLINNGSTLKDIADLLGHTSIESTGIYAKVQVERLKDVALPFPAVANERRSNV